MKEVYFVRHGRTEWNATARMQGQRDSDLDAIGRAQAEVSAKLLAGLGIEAIYASPLRRTRQTVAIIQRRVDLEASYDARIKEWDCGEWSGRLYEDVKRDWATEWAALEADRFSYRGPGCENYPDMIARAMPFLSDVLATSAQRIAVVSHGMIGRVMIGILMGLGGAQMLTVSQPNDVVYRVRLDAGAAPDREVHHYASGVGPIHGYVNSPRYR